MYRAVGIAFVGSAGRILSAVAPFVIFSMYQTDNYSPFLMFAILSLMTLMAMISFPIDLTGKEIDMKTNYNTLSNEDPDNLPNENSRLLGN